MAAGGGRRLALIVPSLGSGGAERVMSTLASAWAAAGETVTLITVAPVAGDFYPLHPGVKRVGLAQMRVSRGRLDAVASNLKRVAALRRAIVDERPDVVISFVDSTNVLTLLATFRLGIPVVVSERTVPDRHGIPRGWAAARRLLYRRAGALVVQSPETAQWARRIVAARKVHVIANPVAPEFTGAEPAGERAANGEPVVMAMGRLSREKGFDLLLRAFARVHTRLPAAELVVLGEGEERPALESLARKLGIDGAVRMPGVVSRPVDALRAADLFVLPSRFEGYPNALAEAMACGLAVVAADCPHGPRQLVRSGETGILVPPEDPVALADAIEALLESPAERRRLAAGALEVRAKLGVERIVEEWCAVLAGLTVGPRRARSAAGRSGG